jgi:hypothetical protein
MKKYFFSLFVLFSIASCKERKVENPDSETVLLLDSSVLKNKDKSAFEMFLNQYRDSVNNFVKGSPLPKFIENYYFDYDNTGLFSPLHSPISLRKLIFDSVYNCDVLKEIITSGNENYFKKPGKRHGIEAELSTLSIADLAKAQSEKIKCK